MRGEYSRKFVHIVIGSFMASWPFFMEMRYVQYLAILFFFGVLLSAYLGIFNAIHAVRRMTLGEMLFPVGIFVAATFSQSIWIYVAAVLHLSLADGLAAIVGTRYGKQDTYRVFGYRKSVAGTLTFLVVSVAITAWTVLLSPAGFGLEARSVLLWLPLAATVLENIGIYGIDNVMVPVLVVAWLNSLPFIF